MEDVLRAEVLGTLQSDKAREASWPHAGQHQEHNEDTETLVDGKPSLAKPYLVSEGEASGVPIEWKGGEMLVMGNAPSILSHCALLTKSKFLDPRECEMTCGGLCEAFYTKN